MKKLKLLLVSLFAVIGMFSVVTITHTSAVDIGTGICNEDVEFKPEICADIEPGNDEDAVNPLYGPDGVLTRAVSGLSLIIGVIAVIVIIVAGIQMTLSAGDAGKVKSARDSIIYAAVGLVIAAMAQAVVRFVLSNIK